MPCLVDQIKEHTVQQVAALKTEVELAQAALKEEAKQTAAELKKEQETFEEKATKENANNTTGLFELAGIASDLLDAVFELAGLVSELKEMKGEDEEMVKLYLIAIKNGEMTIEEVPVLWRSRVQAELDKELEEDLEEPEESENPEEKFPEESENPGEKTEEDTILGGDAGDIEESENFPTLYRDNTSLLS